MSVVQMQPRSFGDTRVCFQRRFGVWIECLEERGCNVLQPICVPVKQNANHRQPHLLRLVVRVSTSKVAIDELGDLLSTRVFDAQLPLVAVDSSGKFSDAARRESGRLAR